MKTLSVISPVYQEANIIADFYCELKAQLNKLQGYNSTILFVVDPGGDDTLKILKDICARDTAVHVLIMSSRFGHQACLLAGIDNTDSDIVIMMDSDLQHPPSFIPKLLKEFEDGGDIVNAVRENTENIGVFKKISARVFYWFINHISTVRLVENAPDFRLISGRVVRLIKEQVRERNLFLRGIISWMGFKQKSVSFVAPERSAGASKYSIARLIDLGLAGAVSFSRKPLRAIFIFGALCFGIVFVLVFLMLFRFIIFNVGPSISTMLLIFIFLLFSIQFIFLGVLGEYLGAIFEEVKCRPHYIVDEKINF